MGQKGRDGTGWFVLCGLLGLLSATVASAAPGSAARANLALAVPGSAARSDLASASPGSAAPVGVTRSAASSDAQAALARAAEPFLGLSRFQAEFVQTQAWVGMDDPLFFKGMLYLERPNRFRLEYSEPEGHLQVCDGDRVYTYVPENEQVLSTQLPRDGRADLLGRILEESLPDPRIEKTELDGVPVEVLTLDPPDGLELERVRLWTRSDSGAILQYELIELSGNQSTFRFLRTWSDPEIDPELFRFEAPPGVPVIEVG